MSGLALATATACGSVSSASRSSRLRLLASAAALVPNFCIFRACSITFSLRRLLAEQVAGSVVQAVAIQVLDDIDVRVLAPELQDAEHGEIGAEEVVYLTFVHRFYPSAVIRRTILSVQAAGVVGVHYVHRQGVDHRCLESLALQLSVERQRTILPQLFGVPHQERLIRVGGYRLQPLPHLFRQCASPLYARP